MAYRLAGADSPHEQNWLKRFDPVYWTVNFPRPMMASVVTTGPHGLRIDAVFYRKDDLAGLIWTSEDRFDHPLLAYETARDYRDCTLSFRWRSAGLRGLDAVNGPTLTIEGRDEGGAPRSWYVRLWNYADGAPDDAVVTLDFGALDGGFLLPEEADPVWAGDIDRMFIALTPVDYDAAGGELAAPAEAWAALDGIVCDGSGSVLAAGDVVVPPHGPHIASGYDDSYHLTPARLVRNIVRLGYRGAVNHYVGMSHYFRLADGVATLAGGALNIAAAAWHADFAARLKDAGLGLIVSLSYELFDDHCPEDWKQRAFDGNPALTGYTSPSALLSPANEDAMDYLKAIARAFAGIAVAAGQAPRFQIGEPWWWVRAGGAICLYDDAAKAAFGGDPPEIADVRGSLDAGQLALLDAAGALLAASTTALHAAVRGDHPACERLLLAYLPGVQGQVARANLPLGWASPAFDLLQLEAYEWVSAGNDGAEARAIDAATQRLGYAGSAQHYLAGFAADGDNWERIEVAAERAGARGVAAAFVWALPQVLRDGFVHFLLGEAPVDAFDDVSFPLALGKEARVAPGFSTAVVTTASGHEQRNADWASARLRYDAGPGVRSEADIETLVGFFRARRGAAKTFRFRDPIDFSSNGMSGTPTAMDQMLGTGDGVATRFELVKRYGEGDDAEARTIARPVAASMLVAVDGIALATGWSLDSGAIVFGDAPDSGAAITAGFLYDVPVRFAEDRLDISLSIWRAGEAPSVPLVEVRE